MPFEFFAPCSKGLEHLLADELKALGAERLRPLAGGVAFFGDRATAYRACLWSRLASRITLILARFDASDAEQLYEGIYGMPWEDIISPRASFTTKAHGANDSLRNARFTALKAKDAIVDHLRQVEGREDPAPSKLRASIDIRLRGQRATVALDLSGEALNHRPYLLEDDRKDAPLECSLAAGALALARAERDPREAFGSSLVDPACGSGIMLVEALSVITHRAPNLGRQRWGFQAWHDHDGSQWEGFVEEAQERFARGCARFAASEYSEQRPADAPFLGLATSTRSIAQARKRLKKAGLRSLASVELGDAQATAEAVERAWANGRKLCGDDPSGCTIATMLPRTSDPRNRASLQADRSSFVAACEASESLGSTGPFIVVGGEDLQARFSCQPQAQIDVENGNARASIAIYDEPPAKPTVIEVASLNGSAPLLIPVSEPQAEQFAARLRKIWKERRNWAAREGISCYRLYDSDVPEYAMAIDVYTGTEAAKNTTYLHIAEYAPPASIDESKAIRRFEDALAIASHICDVRPDRIFAKQRRRSKGGGQYSEQRANAYGITVEENGHRFEVELARYLDTGIFLDHRLTRQLIQEKAQGKRFLNLFAYTGTASVYAAAGGATETTTVDLSHTYLDRARSNMEANGFAGDAHRYVKGDAMGFITERRRARERYDLIFIDPPTFSNSKSMGRKTWDVQRDHLELLIGAAHLLSEGGEIVFSCNLRTFKPDEEALRQHGIEIEDISLQTIPEDFVRTPKIHKCYLVRHSHR